MKKENNTENKTGTITVEDVINLSRHYIYLKIITV